MSAASAVYTVTEFARNPDKLLKRIDRGDIILRRTKGKPAVRLTPASRREEEAAGVDMLSRALTELIRSLQPSMETVVAALEQQNPWVRFLPEEERLKFAHEFLDTISACASISNFARLFEVVHGWRSTAEIYADPELLVRLREPASAASRKRVVRP
ncbi:MAG TPA: hypothetical protein VHO06_27260 [Polyangia bacterium]|nr:hypothetical protein [Polyangia bacterium]